MGKLSDFFGGAVARLAASTPQPDTRDVSAAIASKSKLAKFVASIESYNPDDLISNKGYRIYTQMLRDSEVESAIREKVGSILSTPWSIVPASSDERDIEIANFVEWNFEKMGIEATLEKILDGVTKGHSIGEKIFETARYDGREVWRIKKLKSLDPEIWRLVVDEATGDVTGIKLYSLLDDEATITEMAKFVIWAFNPKYENPWGESELRSVYKNWWFKDVFMKFQAIYLETLGMPIRVGKYKSCATITEQNNLFNILEAIKNNTTIVVPDDFEVEFIDAVGKGADVFDKAIKYQDEQIRKGIVGELLTSTVQDRGARSLGEVHSETKEDSFVKIVRNSLASVVNRQLIPSMVFYNFDGVEEMPSLHLAEKDDVLVKDSAAAEVWFRIGIFSAKRLEDVNMFRRRLNAPELESLDDGIEEPEETIDNPAGDAAIDADYRDIEGDGGDGEDAEDGGTPIFSTDLEAQSGQYFAAPAPDAKKLDNEFLSPPQKESAREIKKRQVADEQEIVPKLAATAALIRDDMVKKVTALLSGKTKIPASDINNLSLKGALVKRFRDDLIEGIQKTIEREYFNAVKEVTEAAPAALSMADFERIELSGDDLQIFLATIEIGAEAAPASAAAGQLKTWKNTGQREKIRKWREGRLQQFQSNFESQAFWVTGIEEQAMLKETKAALFTSLQNSRTLAETIDAVSIAFEPWVATAIANPALAKPSRIETIVRTNNTRAFANARREAFSDPLVKEEFPAMQYSAINDDRTTPQCETLDGEVYRSDDPIWARITPPNHFNCRSTVIPVSVSDFKESSRDPGGLQAYNEAGEKTGKTVMEEIPAEFGGVQRRR